MKRVKLFAMAMMLLTTVAVFAQEKTPAFPGAEGFGRYTTGGRGGKVYCVTNLNDSGEGSLRWALSQPGPRTIVFNVDGTIHLESELGIPSNTTIAGQTAPGMGICVADYPFSVKGSNVIVRYMRIRLGNKNVLKDGADGWDGFGGFDQRDIIIDHCSVSWSIDECLSVYGNVNTTVQWCIAAQSLVNSGHSKGNHGYGCIWGGSGASFHHNLLAHHTSRVPRLGGRPTTQKDERVDMRNNVFYNWGGEGSYGYEGMNVNIVNNYYKPGPGTKASMKDDKMKRIAAPGIRTNSYIATYPAYADMLHVWGKYYVDGNTNASFSDVTNDNWNLGVYNQIKNEDCDNLYTQTTKDTIKLKTPITFVHTTTQSATEAYNLVVQYVGACKGGKHDALDEQYLYDTKNGTATATGNGLNSGFINTQDDNTAIVSQFGSAYPTLAEGEKWIDTDGDGMPDSWETANGLNPNDPTDGNAKTLSKEGYTNLEVYMNSLVEDITKACAAGTPEGGEEVPSSLYDAGSSGYYVFEKNDSHIEIGSITEIEGIVLTLSSDATWTSGGSGSSATTTDGVDLKGYYTAATTDGAPVTFTTTRAGTLTIFFGGALNTGKSINMTDEEGNGLTGIVLSSGEEIANGGKPSIEIPAWDGISYDLESGKTYTFFAGGTKWRLAGFRYVTNGTTGILSTTKIPKYDGAVYDLTGRKVAPYYTPQLPKGIYLINGKKIIVK